MSDSVRPHRRQPTRLPRPWDSPGKNTGVGCHFLLQCRKVKSESEVTQSCPTLSDPMDCSLPGSSIHGIFQARVLEWGAIAFSKNPYKDPQLLPWKNIGSIFLNLLIIYEKLHHRLLWEISLFLFNIGNKCLKFLKTLCRTSLLVQWLRICLPMQGTQIQSLIRQDPTCCGATKLVHHNYWACAPCATATKSTPPRANAPQQEKPPQWEVHILQLESSSCWLQLEESLCSKEDPVQPKISK